LILIFEFYYFKKYGISFIEQISLNHISPFLTNSENSNEQNGNSNFELKVWRNAFSLFRGSEYNRYYLATKVEPLSFYDMNLSAQDHQTFFSCEIDATKPENELMTNAYRERNPVTRIKTAHKVLELNPENACAYILLAEEEATTIIDAELILRQALKVAESNYKKSTGYQGSIYESSRRRDLNVLIYIKRRLAMCWRKLGKLKEAAKMFRDLTKEPPTSIISVLNVHENLLECLLEMKNYSDAQTVLSKYDDISLPKSAAICYTAALLKARLVAEKFQPEVASRRGLTTAELQAVEAIHRAVEFNPHVPKYLLEMKKLIFPAEHILKRGDSEALAVNYFKIKI
jgi:tetratricopeptide (TPR) repeat protein